MLLGFPVDLYIGWVLLWGTLPALLLTRASFAFILLALFGVDLLLMPLGQPVIQLGSSWLFGEAFGLALCAVPALLPARWTTKDSRLGSRIALIGLGIVGLVFGAMTATILDGTGGSWNLLLERPLWLTGIFLQLLAIPAVTGLTAVQEFAVRGLGTPIPFDPPKRLVTSGIYGYLRNPMQVSVPVVLVGWGLLLGSPWIALAGLMTVIFSIGLAAWNEDDDMHERFGEEWSSYTAAVNDWRPHCDSGT